MISARFKIIMNNERKSPIKFIRDKMSEIRRFFKDLSGIKAEAEFKPGDYVFSHRFMEFATVKKVGYYFTIHGFYLFLPKYYVETVGELGEAEDGCNIHTGWDDWLIYLEYKAEEMHDWYYLPDRFDWLPDHIGIVGARIDDYTFEETKCRIHVALDSPIYFKNYEPALRAFPDICEMMNWHDAAALSLFRPEYITDDYVQHAGRVLTNDQIDDLMECLNTEVPRYWLKYALIDSNDKFYSWNVAEEKFLRSLPKITVWHQLIFEYNERMKYSDKKDFLDITMPIPDYTTLKTRNQ